MLSLCAVLACFQTNVGGDYYTGEYDYTTVDGSQPETPTETAGQGQVFFTASSWYYDVEIVVLLTFVKSERFGPPLWWKILVRHRILSSIHPINLNIPVYVIDLK